ncbi:MAG TPA: trypsin-like serine protease [Sandaracinaceae bacterium LLY-WYZ-13_1]|nr:trypsin-like serine protease [Sandaracinaceae bacterium LLY-WYZ-13_1]
MKDTDDFRESEWMPRAARRYLSVPASLASLLLLSLAQCTAPDEARPSRAHIIDGTLAFDANGVVQVRIRSTRATCTGALIAPDVVLTAKHCLQVSGAPAPYPPSDVEVMTANAIVPGMEPTAYPVEGVRVPPGIWHHDPDSGTSTGLIGEDVAVLRLSTPIPDFVAQPYAVRRASTDGLWGAAVVAVGYGHTPTDPSSGVRRRASTTIDAVSEEIIYTRPGVTCTGDSGGPLFLDTGDGGLGAEVLGVLSFGPVGCGTEGANGYTRLDGRWIAMIDEELTIASGEALDAGVDGGPDGAVEAMPDASSPVDASVAADASADAALAPPNDRSDAASPRDAGRGDGATGGCACRAARGESGVGPALPLAVSALLALVGFRRRRGRRRAE